MGRGRVFSGILLLFCSAEAKNLCLPIPGISHESLATVAPIYRPHEHIDAFYERQQPFYVGITPAEVIEQKTPPSLPSLPRRLKKLANNQVEILRKKLNVPSAEFEMWPAQNGLGQTTWVISRWRPSPDQPWKWLQENSWKSQGGILEPILPSRRNPGLQEDRSLLFDDFLKQKGLYDKPLFSNSVWTDKSGSEILGAWLSPDQASRFQSKILSSRDVIAWSLPRPADFNSKPMTFTLKTTGQNLKWNRQIVWEDETSHLAHIPTFYRPLTQWSDEIAESYKEDVKGLAGEKEVVYPSSGRSAQFVRKSSADPRNQLGEMVDYLTERYETLGFIQSSQIVPGQKIIYRQKFMWRGIPQANLIAVIPGSLKGNQNKPIIVADHIDTAFAEDVYQKTGHRRSVPGADDNVTAVAGLLATASSLHNLRPLHDIWLVHLTGEEFPSEDLGARHFVEELIKNKQQISGVLIMDMIGYRKRNDRVFQINAGNTKESVLLMAVARASAQIFASQWDITLRFPEDPKNYVYNTDVATFNDQGFAGVLFNEHVNAEENLLRADYHSTTDRSDKLDFDFALDIVKTTAETAARLSFFDNLK